MKTIGEGQIVSVRVSRLSSAKSVQLRIRNGYQKTKRLWKANSAPKRVLITLYDRDKNVYSRKFTLKQKWGWQELMLKIPGEKGISTVELKIESVYRGRVYKDTCISDMQILVESKVEYILVRT